jgi:hypothetical protein
MSFDAEGLVESATAFTFEILMEGFSGGFYDCVNWVIWPYNWSLMASPSMKDHFWKL